VNKVFADAEALSRGAAQWLCTIASERRGRFAICCSGGSTSRRLYELLAEPQLASRFPWSQVHWFWGDERFVPHNHPDSNYGTARQALFSRVNVPDANIHPIPTAFPSPQQCAEQYESTLKAFYQAERLDPAHPLFDVTLLGLGEDGHTASLFPGHSALEERSRWTAAVVGARTEARITLTYPALDSSALAVFLVTGVAKANIVASVQLQDRALPAARVQPVGRLHWFVDSAAASAITPR
jgi:6-phosphogluconolactonase